MRAPVHFLHVRKTGGMAIKAALAEVATEFSIALHNHNTTLADIPRGEGVFFTVRDTVARFVSGFNSRLRKGQPLLYNEWTPQEAEAFARFGTPNELAEALSSSDPSKRVGAGAAMRDIRHVNALLSMTLGSQASVAERLPDIVWIAFTETLRDDFQEIKSRLALPARLALPNDDLTAHRTPSGLSGELSALGRRNLEEWYAADIAFVTWLREARLRFDRTAN